MITLWTPDPGVRPASFEWWRFTICPWLYSHPPTFWHWFFERPRIVSCGCVIATVLGNGVTYLRCDECREMERR